MSRNDAMRVQLNEQKGKMDEFLEMGNPTRFRGCILSGFKEVFRNDYVQMKTKNIYDTPCSRFCKMHSGHQDIERLRRAHECGDMREYNKLRACVLSEGWRGF